MVLYLVVGSKRAVLAEQREDVDWVVLRGRVVSEASLRAWVHKIYDLPLDAPLPLVVAGLAERGWTVLQQLDPGPPHKPGSPFCQCRVCVGCQRGAVKP